MSYELDHNLPPPSSSTPPTNPLRPDMSTFFAAFDRADSTRPSHTNIHATPTPVDMGAIYTLAAESYQLVHAAREAAAGGNSSSSSSSPEDQEQLLLAMVSTLLSGADAPPKEIQGVDQEFLDRLERVDRKSFGKDEACPICTEKFIDDKHPLVVELPCHPGHRFDLECVAPWLKLQGTCPLDRKDLTKKKEAPKRELEEGEDEEEYESMYA